MKLILLKTDIRLTELGFASKYHFSTFQFDIQFGKFYFAQQATH